MSVSGPIEQLAPTPAGNLVYATNGTAALQVFDFLNDTVEPIELGCAGFGLALTPDGVQLYASCAASGEVKIIDVASRAVTGTLPVRGSPRLVAISPDGGTVVVPNSAGWVDFIR